jgi:zinc and cadmium transporter
MFLIEPLLATIFVSLLSFSGAIFLSKKKILQQASIPYFVSFAAGVMLGTALLDILPHAIEDRDPHEILIYTLWGIVGSFIFERFILWHHHHEDKHKIKPSAFLVLTGDAIHNFVDGVMIAASFMVSPALGISTTLAIVAHEIPQEFADFSVLLFAGFSRAKALFYNFLSATTAIIGTLFGLFFLAQYQELLPVILAISAGIFIYIACSDLIPELHREHHNEFSSKHLLQTLPFIIGIFMIILLTSIVGEY